MKLTFKLWDVDGNLLTTKEVEHNGDDKAIWATANYLKKVHGADSVDVWDGSFPVY